MDISLDTINKFLYGPGTTWVLNTTEFYYWKYIVSSGAFQCNVEKREVFVLLLTRYIAVDRERRKKATPGYSKATLTFVEYFFWLLIRNGVSLNKADSPLTWDWAIVVVKLVCLRLIFLGCFWHRFMRRHSRPLPLTFFINSLSSI